MKDDNATPLALVDWFDDFGTENPYAALSNFYIGEPLRLAAVFGDLEFQTGEHLFAAFKARTHDDFMHIVEADGPAEAKAIGRSIPLRSDWETVKYDAMLATIGVKFTSERHEGDVLLSTGDALLIEGTYWGDQVWGVDLAPKGALVSPGRNWLGTMLMSRRAELRAGWLHNVSSDHMRYHNALFAARKATV